MNELNCLLQRYSDDGQSTLGLMFVDRNFCGYTLEDENRPVKIAGETRIDAGRFELKLKTELTPLTQKYRDRFPRWFQWHVEIVGLPRHKDVYVHIGNTERDTAACVLIGNTANNNVVGDGMIGDSVSAFKYWYEWVAGHLSAGGQAFIKVRDEAWLHNAAPDLGRTS